MSLFRRVVLINAGVLVMAALVLALSPATVSPTVTAAEWIVLAIGTGLMIAVNVVVMRRVFGPLQRLEATMERIDPLDPGRRIALWEPDDEIARLGKAFNAMLDRLEQERADSGRQALRAQEAERARLARELHDELGQLLTAVVPCWTWRCRAGPVCRPPWSSRASGPTCGCSCCRCTRASSTACRRSRPAPVATCSRATPIAISSRPVAPH